MRKWAVVDDQIALGVPSPATQNAMLREHGPPQLVYCVSRGCRLCRCPTIRGHGNLGECGLGHVLGVPVASCRNTV